MADIVPLPTDTSHTHLSQGSQTSDSTKETSDAIKNFDETEARASFVAGDMDLDVGAEVEVDMLSEDPNSNDPETLALKEAQANLVKARDDFLKASEEVLQAANEYMSVEDLSQELQDAARALQMMSSKKWYNFWEKASRIPKDSKYELWNGEKKTWKEIAEENTNIVKEIAEEGQEGWKKAMAKNGLIVETHAVRSVGVGAKIYRVKGKLAAAPKLILLALLRAPILGQHDGDLHYMREHYNFVGGRTSLVHTIRKILPYDRVFIRDFFDLTNWEENEETGEIIFTATSVKALAGKIPKTVRGQNVLFGLKITPANEDRTESNVVMISHAKVGGWVPNFVLDWGQPGVLIQQLKSLETAAKTVADSGEGENLVRKFVYREIEEAKPATA